MCCDKHLTTILTHHLLRIFFINHYRLTLLSTGGIPNLGSEVTPPHYAFGIIASGGRLPMNFKNKS